MKRLLAAGAEPNATNSAGATALMWAYRHGQDAAAARRRCRRKRTVRRSANGPRRHQRDRRRGAGAQAAARLRAARGRGGRRIRLRCAKRCAPTTRKCFRCCWKTIVSPKGRGAADDVHSHELFQVCRDYRLTVGRYRASRRNPKLTQRRRRYDPGRASRPTPLGAMPATPIGHPRSGRSQPATAPGQRRGFHQADRLRLLSPQQHRLAGGCGGSRPRPICERGHGEDAVESDRHILATWRDRTLQNMSIAGATDTIGYLLLGLSADDYPPDAATDAQAIWLKRRQAADGHWRIRPPAAH